MNRITCEDAFRELDDYLDGALGSETTRLIDEHLAVCSACLREFTFERSVLDGVREKLGRVVLPSALMKRISDALDQADSDDPSAGQPPATRS